MSETSAPARQEAWIPLLVLFSSASFIEAIFYGAMSAFTPLYLPVLGVPAGQVALWTGIIAAASSLAGLPFLPFWGALADRYARRPVIIRSFLVELVVCLICIFSRNVWLFLAARAISGLALGNSGLMLTTLAERAPARRQGLAFAIMNAAAPVGVFVGPLAGGPLVDRLGFPALLGIEAVLLLVVVLGLSFGYQDSYTARQSGPLLKMAWDGVRLIGRSPRLRALFPSLFLLFAGWMMAMSYVPVMVKSLYSGPDQGTQVGLVLGAGGLAAILLAPLTGAIADKLGHERVLIFGSILTVILWPLPALVRGLALFAAAWALINGLASGVFSISFNVLSDSAAPEARGRVMTFAYLPVNVGGILGPGLGSLITSASVFTVFPAAALLTGLGVLALLVARKNPPV